MKGKTKKALLAVTCVTLVAVMTVAGTFAYFQDTSEDVVNTFNPNSVHVELTETDEKGETVYGRDDYSIIPGTWQEKDPKVTVEATLPSYVYLEVIDTANTDGKTLIDYAIVTGDDGWIPLEGYANVYYREFTPETDDSGKLITTAEYPVLVDDKVSYPASLTNEDMYTTETDGEGNTVSVLRSDIALSFKAAAIQKEGFTPESGWLQIPVEVSTVEEFEDALKNGTDGKPVQLTEDITIENVIPQSNTGTTQIDLNGHTLETSSGTTTSVKEGHSLVLENGTVKFTGQESSKASINVNQGASITLDHVTLESSGAAIFPRGDAAEVNIISSTITSTGSYCVATNAATVENYNVVINLRDSVFNAHTAVLVNVPCKLNMENCTVNADMQGVVVRGGTANIRDCKISNTATAVDDPGETFLTYFQNRNWGSGNMVNLAGITIGNKAPNAYQYPSDVTLINTSVNSAYYPTVYVYGNSDPANGVTLVYDNNSSVGNVIYGGGYVVINEVIQSQ